MPNPQVLSSDDLPGAGLCTLLVLANGAEYTTGGLSNHVKANQHPRKQRKILLSNNFSISCSQEG